MSATLYFATLLLGVLLGWQGRLAATAFVIRRRGGSSGPAQVVDVTDKPGGGTAGPELDLRDTTIYDWRNDPELAGCEACHGTGRIPLMCGRIVRCPCGARFERLAIS